MNRGYTMLLVLSFIHILPSCKTVPRNQSGVLVTNGEHIKHTDFPNTIALYNQLGEQFCSATLVGTNVALTAAHCVEGKSVPPFIIVGSNEYEPTKAVHVKAYSDYSDLAVLIFENSPFINTVRIAEEDPPVDALGTVIGYGCDGVFGGAGKKKLERL